MRSLRRSSALAALAALGLPVASMACSGSQGDTPAGQSDFVSAPAGGAGGSRGESFSGGAANAGAAAPSAPGAPGPTKGVGTTKSPARSVQETDLYRLEGTRLYYLNSYRGLMVFDVTNVDQPRLLGRSAIFGSPVDMVVKNGIATVVVGDWYGTLDSGAPFHGSIVRGLDATDPANIKVIGEAKLGGWVQEDRVVGNVLYAVSEDQGWVYDWGYAGPVFAGGAGGGVAVGIASPAGGTNGPSVIVSSVDFSGGQVKQVASKTYAGYGGVFNVTPFAIMLAHPDVPAVPDGGGYVAPTQTDLQYLDISDPGGQIVERGTLKVDGTIDTYGADNGRWNLDFADGVTAHVLASGTTQGGATGTNYVLSTADFSNPDQPKLASALPIPSLGWNAVARFDSGRMYLSPDSSYYYGGTTMPTSTPLDVFDLSNPLAPALAGQTQVPGNVWLMIPSGTGTRLFALGSAQSQSSSQVALTYVDVTNAAAPAVIGTSAFGEGWTSTPASDTFKAFTMDPTRLGPSSGLVVLPFSGWDSGKSAYNNGVQLIEFTPSSITTAGAARTKGWVERGIFVNGRVVSLSDLALSVVDYTDPLQPKVTAELTLARNVIAAQPGGATIAEVSTDWWENDVTHSDVRVLPTTDAEENRDESSALDVAIDGVDAQVFTNGSLDYLVTRVQIVVPCGQQGTGVGTAPSGPVKGGTSPATQCTAWQEQVQVVDLSNGGAKLRGKVALPVDPNGYYYSGGNWVGCYYYDWFDGAPVVQVEGSALAFRRWSPNYSANGTWIDGSSDLFVVDLSNPDAPTVASSVITSDPTGWWGDMTVVGSTLYTSHYEWVEPPVVASASGGNVVQNSQPTTRYYLDRIDLSDRKHPKIKAKINVPGVLVGGSQTDPDVLYTVDSNWDASTWRNSFDVIRIHGDRAYLQSKTPLDGWTGRTIVRGTTAYLSTQVYSDRLDGGQPAMELHQIDLSKPTQPVDRVVSGKGGWGWLLDVQGDRAMVTSGWGPDGLDVYKLTPNAAPVYDQFVRTRGWSVQSLTRQSNQMFLSSGYWGVQTVTLQ